MALLNAGYWPTTYWLADYWNPKYWPKHGTAAVGGDSSLLLYYSRKRRGKEKELFVLIKELLEALQ